MANTIISYFNQWDRYLSTANTTTPPPSSSIERPDPYFNILSIISTVGEFLYRMSIKQMPPALLQECVKSYNQIISPPANPFPNNQIISTPKYQFPNNQKYMGII